MTLSRADQLRQRAREIEDQAWCIRWDHSTESRRLSAIARELVELAQNLPPEPRSDL